MTPFPYQDKHVNDISSSLKEHRTVLAQLATGGGKTVEFATIAHRYIQRSIKSVVILVHRIELLTQTRITLYNSYGIEPELITAGVKYVAPARVYLCMVESVIKRLGKLKNVGLVIIDECHIASFNKMHTAFPDQLIIGFTATPKSSSKRFPLKNYYETIVCGPSILDLIKLKRLSQNITWAPKDVVDRNAIAIKNGDFDESAMGVSFSKPRYIQNTVLAYEKWAKGQKTIVFNVNLSHSIEVAKAFVLAGYNAKYLDSTMDDKIRKSTLRWFSDTDDAILCNVGIATTGFDEPSTETVIVNKATLSMPLWLQMTGRGARVVPGIKHTFQIIDMGGNAITHGDWCDDRNWEDIFYNPDKPGDEEGIAPCKECPNCDAILPSSAKACQFCGYKFETKAIPIETELRDFVVITKNIDVAAVMEEHKAKREYHTMFQLGRSVIKDAKETIPVMSDEIANFIAQQYLELVKKWIENMRKKGGAHRYDEWHRKTATDYINKLIKESYPQWQQPQALAIITV